MTTEAKSLLKKMADEFDRSKKNSFDSIFYAGYSNNVLNELSDGGYISVKDDVVGTIMLTNEGYDKSIG